MIARSTAVVAALCASMLAGCDTVHGIQRTASFGHPVDWDCVQTAIEAAHPGTEITVRQSESEGFKFTWKFAAYAETNRYVFYTIPASLEIAIHSTITNGEVTLPWSQSFFRVNQRVPDSEIATLREAMVATEAEASARCGLDFSNAKERVD